MPNFIYDIIPPDIRRKAEATVREVSRWFKIFKLFLKTSKYGTIILIIGIVAFGAILVFAFSQDSTETIEVFSTQVSGDWQNKENAFQKELGEEATLAEFSSENSATLFKAAIEPAEQIQENQPESESEISSQSGEVLGESKEENITSSENEIASESVPQEINEEQPNPSPEQEQEQVPESQDETQGGEIDLNYLEFLKQTGIAVGGEEEIEEIPIENILSESGTKQDADELLNLIEQNEEVPSISEPNLIMHSLVFSGFESEKLGEINRAQLAFSWAVQKRETNDILLVEYKLSEGEWGTLFLIQLNTEEHSNFSNNGYWKKRIPEILSWEDINSLEVRFTLQSINSESRLPIYLDAVWLDVEYIKPENGEVLGVQDLKDEYDFELLSNKKDFKINDNLEFKFYIKKKQKTNILLDLISSDFLETVNIKTEVIDSGNRVINEFNPQVQNQGNDEFDVVLNKKNFYQFRPGKYKLKIEIENDEGFFVGEQEFTLGVLAINTNKSIFLPGETAYLQMAALRDDGHTICDANLKLEITSPNKELSSVAVQKSGECGPDNVTDMPDYFAYYQVNGTGVYQIKLKNLDTDYEITDSFEVRDSVPFEVERIGPTRIYPPADYEMTLKIKANQDFIGEVVETVPDGFEVKSQNAKIKITDQNSKIISWDVDWKAGEIYELKYEFDAPDISPYIYLLGPLKIGDPSASSGQVFQETRKWQIAADSPGSNGMLVYAEDAGLTPLYRTWNGSDLSAASSSLQAAEANHGEVIYTVLKSNPRRSEYIYGAMGWDSTDTHLDIQIYSGSTWSDGTGAPTNGDFTTNLMDSSTAENWYRPFDIAYEETTGDALVVYEDTAAAADASISYKLWDGSSWVASESYVYPAASTGEVRYIRMAPRPGTDDILIVFSDSNSDLFSVLWDGSAMDVANDQIISSDLGIAIHRGWDLAWESQGDTALIVYSNAGPALDFCIHDGTTCTDQNDATLTSIANQSAMWLELAADPNSDYIALMFQNSQVTMDLYMDMWDGTDWDTAATEPGVEGSGVEEGYADDITQAFDIAWERGNSEALFVFIDDGATVISYFLYAVASDSYWCPEVQTNEAVTDMDNVEGSNGPCDDAAVASWIDDVSEVLLVPSNIDSEIMLTAYNDITTTFRPEQMLWTGTTNTWSQTTEQNVFEDDLSPDAWTAVSTDNQPRAYDFAWEAAPLVNYVPTIKEVSLNSKQAINLLEGSTVDISASASVTDTNGCSDISGVKAIVYQYDDYTASCSSDSNNCYDEDSFNCVADGACSSRTQNYNCYASSSMQFFTDPTDNGSSFSADEWVVTVIASDSAWADVSSNSYDDNDESDVEVNSLTAVEITAGSPINYGTVVVGQNTGAANQTVTVKNTGNKGMDIMVYGTNLTGVCGTITVGNQQYASNSFTYNDYGRTLLVTPGERYYNGAVSWIKPTSSSPITNNIYWGINVPEGTAPGTCSGTNTFSATAEQ